MAIKLSSILNKSFKKINLPVVGKGLLHNKYVLYIVVIVALINLLNEAIKADFVYCTVFILIGFITAFFNKNMIVILTITLAASAIIRHVIRVGNFGMEGFQESATEKKADDATDKDKDSAKDKKDTDSSVPAIKDAKISTPSSGLSGCTKASSASSSNELIGLMQKDAVELMSVQNDIISGFQTIEPAMDRAEALIGSIQSTAQTIESLKHGMRK